MAPLYIHCPHCGFPAIVNGLDRVVPRRCRQCRAEYTPGLQASREPNPGETGRVAAQRARLAIQARVKQHRRCPK